MLYEQTSNGLKDLPIKVLDMGMGHERNAWFSQGAASIYDATFPFVCKKLYNLTGINPDQTFMKAFVPLGAFLNVNEVENTEKSWKDIATKIKMSPRALKEKILPLAAIYSLAEHSRALLVALNDAALPSNVGGGYNLRMLARRAFSFIEKYNWDISLPELCTWHAHELNPLFPELSENLELVRKILDVEKKKHEENKEKLLEAYDSYGIQPEALKEEAEKLGKKILIPENFYSLVAARHEKNVQEHETKKEYSPLNLTGVPETKIRYYEDYSITSFQATVLKIIENGILLDQTYFYPTSGGQVHDLGFINKNRVLDVYRQGGYMIHILDAATGLKQGSKVICEIDKERRIQLAQHHTSTHIVNAAARTILGNHVNQAGAKKTLEKAHIDLTHFQTITEEELRRIEVEANNIVQAAIPVQSSFMSRNEAEKKYGMSIYQGGVPIGKELRIVNIPGKDVECCGGTHLKNTSEAKKIKLLKASKISDSIVRIEFVAGKAAERQENQERNTTEVLAQLLACKPSQVPGRAQELFEKWKTLVKKGKQTDLTFSSKKSYQGEDIIEKVAEIYKTQPEFVIRTTERFLRELKEKANK